MKYFFFLMLLSNLFVNSCNSVTTKDADAKVVEIVGNEIRFSDGSKKKFPKVDNDAIVMVLVRHAEKMTDKKDPDLTPEGKARANNLANIMKNAALDKIYSSTFKRTFMTAMPTIQAYNNKDHGSYRTDKVTSFIDTLLEHEKGKRFLIVGHSNTTPAILNHLLGNRVYHNIEENDYGKIYVAVSKGLGATEVLELNY